VSAIVSCKASGQEMVSLVISQFAMKNLHVWLVVELPTPLKNDGGKVSWDDDIPNIWKK